MARTKGSKNRIAASTDFDAQIAKLQKDKAMLEEGFSKTVAHIEELKTDIKSLRESLKPQKAGSSRPKKKSQSWRPRRLPPKRRPLKKQRKLKPRVWLRSYLQAA